jgi:hypothetical protein
VLSLRERSWDGRDKHEAEERTTMRAEKVKLKHACVKIPETTRSANEAIKTNKVFTSRFSAAPISSAFVSQTLDLLLTNNQTSFNCSLLTMSDPPSE